MDTIETEKNIISNPESSAESVERTTPESGIETEQNLMSGAEMLETPSDGSFVHGLSAFIAWVKALVADD